MPRLLLLFPARIDERKKHTKSNDGEELAKQKMKNVKEPKSRRRRRGSTTARRRKTTTVKKEEYKKRIFFTSRDDRRRRAAAERQIKSEEEKWTSIYVSFIGICFPCYRGVFANSLLLAYFAFFFFSRLCSGSGSINLQNKRRISCTQSQHCGLLLDFSAAFRFWWNQKMRFFALLFKSVAIKHKKLRAYSVRDDGGALSHWTEIPLWFCCRWCLVDDAGGVWRHRAVFFLQLWQNVGLFNALNLYYHDQEVQNCFDVKNMTISTYEISFFSWSQCFQYIIISFINPRTAVPMKTF